MRLRLRLRLNLEKYEDAKSHDEVEAMHARNIKRIREHGDVLRWYLLGVLIFSIIVALVWM